MAVRAYILIGTTVGTAGTVYSGLHKLAVADAKVLSADTVTGPFDVIASWSRRISIGSARRSPRAFSAYTG